MQEYTLMMQQVPVLTYEGENLLPNKIKEISKPELLPFYLINNVTIDTLSKWLNKRSIPDNRDGLTDFISAFGISATKSVNKASLSDPYWIKVSDNNTWNKINFFKRKYDLTTGDAFFYPWSVKKEKLKGDSPDLTTGGILNKRWRQKEDLTSYLVKAGSKLTHQEPLSEILTSVLLEQLNFIPFVRYDYAVEGITLCSKCDNFVTEEQELIPASLIYSFKPRKDDVSIPTHLLHMCDLFQIDGTKEYIDKMLFIDNLVANSDRNLSNICFVRNIKTNVIKPAPLFDFSAAFWSKGKIDKNSKNKVFPDLEAAAVLKYQKYFDIEELKRNIAYKDCIKSYPEITTERKEALINGIEGRTKELTKSKILMPTL